MNFSRRSFVKGCVAASGVAVVSSAAPGAEGDPKGQEYYELRCYRMAAGSRLKQDADPQPLHRYLEGVLLPALEQLDVHDVGAFTELEVDREALTSQPKPGSPVWLLIPHRSLDSFLRTADLLEDPELRAAGADYLEAPPTSPPFERLDTWLLRAFRSMPRMEVPAFSRARAAGRVYEMRTYESYSELRARAKMAMFDEGETELMRSLGMAPLFFGQALAGSDLPHLTYVTGASDLATHFANWAKFGPDPRWTAMKDLPQYAHSVSKNIPRFLAPTAYSDL